MALKYTAHALKMLEMRNISKETIERAVMYYDNKWTSAKDSKKTIFALDKIRVVLDIEDHTVVTFYEYGVRESWHQ